MMSGSDVELSALLAFAGDLIELRQAIASQRARLASNADQIRTDWDDETYVRHRHHLNQMLAEIEGFERECDRQADFMQRKYTAGMNVLRSGR